MNAEQLKQADAKFIMPTYGRYDIVMDKGKGAFVFDKDGKKYIDFVQGIACSPLGHSHPAISKAISFQAKKLIQASNYFYSEAQIMLAKKLCGLSGLSKCFFGNSGTEANEAALKLAKKITKKTDFIACENAFHGRSHGSLSATWKASFREPFFPLVEGFSFVPYNDVAAMEKAITPKTAAVILEPIQGEAGVVVPSSDYLEKVSAICKKRNILLILDEVQTGNGRTGSYFAYQQSGIVPDIVTTAKGLANGVPIGVCLSNFAFEAGNHASTFGGNSLACSAANSTVDIILKQDLMKNATSVGDYFMQKLKALPHIISVRGKGLLIGAELDVDAKKVVVECIKEGLIINSATPATLRFLPPLNITKKDVDASLKILEKVLSNG
ncbi:MAG TPA: aspartate aminotransferase family protein [Candidatus Nanoarchaeia archaeon]|nr:aspartate aminotransferase family protein [Candidatus Nanoarchaeia archaeon]